MNEKLEPRKDPKVMVIEAKLKDRISINMDKQPLSEAVTFLQNYTGLNIVLDPKALADEGLSSSSPVSLVTNDTQLKTVLKLMLRPLGLTYKLEDDVILITSPQATQASTITKPYYVGDLVMPADHAPQILLPHAIFDPEQDSQNAANQPGFGMNDPRFPLNKSGVGSAKGERPEDRHVADHPVDHDLHRPGHVANSGWQRTGRDGRLRSGRRLRRRCRRP